MQHAAAFCGSSLASVFAGLWVVVDVVRRAIGSLPFTGDAAGMLLDPAGTAAATAAGGCAGLMVTAAGAADDCRAMTFG